MTPGYSIALVRIDLVVDVASVSIASHRLTLGSVATFNTFGLSAARARNLRQDRDKFGIWEPVTGGILDDGQGAFHDGCMSAHPYVADEIQHSVRRKPNA